MSDPVNAGAPTGAAVPNPTAPAAPAAAPASAAPMAAAPVAAPVVAAPADPATLPAAPAAEPPKPEPKYINPHARLARQAQSGKATSTAQAAELGAKLSETQTRLDAQTAVLKSHADLTLASLPESARAAVMKRAGGDPVKALEAVALLREAGALNPVLAQPANTATPTQAPAAGAVTDPDVAAYLEWKAAADKGLDLVAARLRISNGAAIAAGAQKHATKN